MITLRSRLAAAALIGSVAGLACAQSIESDLPPGAEPHTEKPGFFVLPDHGLKRLLDALKVTDEDDRFSAKFGLVVMPADYTSFDQDDVSRQQVGHQQDEFEARSLRLMARGHFVLFRRWNYVASYEYKGFGNEPGDPDWSATDLRVSTEIGKLGTLTVGKMKEPYAYEMVGDAANLPHTERLLSPFFVSRSEGVQLSNTMLDQRGTWAVGWFNDWLSKGDSFSDSGNDIAARVTALPVSSEDGARYLHVAASVRYYAGDDDTLRFRGQPASHVSDFFVDTGNIAGDHAWNTGLEALWNVAGFSLLGEYVTSSVSSRAAGDPDFDG